MTDPRGPYYDDGDVTLHHGDAADIARDLPRKFARTIVTSPPYYALRDYGHENQLGSENSVEEYVDRLVRTFRALRDVLTDDGTIWLNLGDSYGPGKQLLGVPWEVAFALRRDGWILRADVIWSKPNPMPEGHGAKDRPVRAHEYVFLLAKQPRYYYDADAIAEDVAPHKQEHYRRYAATVSIAPKANPNRKDGGQNPTQAGFNRPDAEKRVRRTVWEVATVPFAGSHFAVFPPELVRPCILAGSAPGDIVLDPFSGSGTTGMVATFEGRKYVGIDVNSDYLDLSLRTRFAAPTLGIETVTQDVPVPEPGPEFPSPEYGWGS